MDAVAASEISALTGAVSQHTLHEKSRHPNVENAALAGHHVDVVSALLSHESFAFVLSARPSLSFRPKRNLLVAGTAAPQVTADSSTA
jgi:hypothetical protein